MKKYLYSILAVAAVLSACAKVDQVEKTVEPKDAEKASFYGTIEQPEGLTRTYILEENDAAVSINWSAGDVISVYGKATGGSMEFAADQDGAYVYFGSSDSGAGDFLKENDKAGYDAYYPVWAKYDNWFDGGQIDLSCKSSDTDKNGNNINQASLLYMPMYAELKGDVTPVGPTHTQRPLQFSCAYHAILKLTVPASLAYNRMVVLEGSKVLATINNIDELEAVNGVKTIYVPIPVEPKGVKKYSELTFEAYNGSTSVATMFTFNGEDKTSGTIDGITVGNNIIYAFDYCNTLTIDNPGEYELTKNGLDYKINISQDIEGEIIINANGEEGEKPANIYINARGHNVKKLTVNAPESHVEITNGAAVEVKSITSINTFVVKKDFFITGLTVEKGSVVVSKNDEGESTVARITVPSTVTEDINITIEKLDKEATPVHITNESTSANVNVTGIKGENAKDKGKEYYVDGDGAENVHSTPTADVIEVHPNPDFTQTIPKPIIETLGSNLFYESNSEISGIPVPSKVDDRLVLKSKYSGVFDFSNGLSLNQIGTINGLDVCYIFAAKDPDGSDGSYDEWYADFVVSLDRDVNEGEIGLWGFYASWMDGLSMAFPAPQYIPAGTEVELLGLMSKSGHSTFTYSDIKTDVRVFPCGAFKLSDNINGATMTVDLRIYNPNQGHEGEYIVIDSYKYKFTNKTNAVITPIGETGVAKIGTVGYPTLAAAIAAVPDGTETTITMVNDFATTEKVTIAAAKNIVLELNGKKISYTADACGTFIENKGQLKVQDSGTNGIITAKFTAPNWSDGCYTINNSGTYEQASASKLVIESGTIENTSPAGLAWPISNGVWGTYADLVINGGTIHSTNYVPVREYLQYGGKKTIVINGGKLISDESRAIAVQLNDATVADQGSYVEINGGEFSCNGSGILYVDLHATNLNTTGFTMTVNDGKFKNANTSAPVLVYDYESNIQTSAVLLSNVLKGGVYSTAPANDIVGNGYNVVENSDEETKTIYPWTVKKEEAKQVTSQEEFEAACAAAKSGDKLVLGNGEFAIGPVDIDGKTLTFKGQGATNTKIFIGNGGSDGNDGHGSSKTANMTFEDVTLDDLASDAGYLTGFTQAAGLTFRNVTFNFGFSNWGNKGGDVSFYNCTFNQNVDGKYNVQELRSDNNTHYLFDGCTFNSAPGRFINAYKQGGSTKFIEIIVKNCSFIGTSQSKAAVNLKSGDNGCSINCYFLGKNTVNNVKIQHEATGSALFADQEGTCAKVFVGASKETAVLIWENQKKTEQYIKPEDFNPES